MSLKLSKYVLQSFTSYTDGTFRIVVKERKTGKVLSKPLNKTDKNNFHNFSGFDKVKLIKKYFK